jgi:hypothetical protein
MMSGLLSHALASMAAAAVLNLLLGLPPIAFGIFMAGVISMVMEQDYDELSPNRRTPLTHSLFFGCIWVIILSIIIQISLAVTSRTIAQELTVAVVAAFTTHLAIDAFTREGIYTVPRGFDIKKMIMGLPRGEIEAWGYWSQFRIKKIGGRNISRANEDPILNAAVSLPSLMIIIIFVAAMPPPV